MNGNRVREFRQARGFTQIELALRSGSTVPYLGWIERHGLKPKADLRRRIAAALGGSEIEAWPELESTVEGVHDGAIA